MLLKTKAKHKINYQIIGPVVSACYRKRIESFSLKNNIQVQFLGELYDSELEKSYSRAHAFVMAKANVINDSVEGLGLVFLKASAAKLPIVAYLSGGVA